MARELAFVMINPHTLSKSRTGGVIARYLARTDLDLVAARMVNPPQELVDRYADQLRASTDGSVRINKLIGDYIAQEYSPNPVTGKARRVMVLLFEGEDAVDKIWQVTGGATLRQDCGQTVRETYGEFVEDADGSVRYFEPAVLVGPTVERANRTLRLWSEYMAAHGGIVSSSSPYPEGDVQKTLVLLKPDNFRGPSLRPGSIIDVLSASSLRIVGAKKFRMTVAQAEQFYGPVVESLSGKFVMIGAERAANALTQEFGFAVSASDTEPLCEMLGARFAAEQFESIVEFMTGHRPASVMEADKETAAQEECLALVYKGVDAVETIRDILGSTDPSKARFGSVRREFGSNIMVNSAHASDSPENAIRELGIVHVEEDTISPWIDQYCR
ncbi:MAG: nucleoside-diphosphate kinase [Verrucomicrobia bacterium]|jgi:nucleoside diphosphate kinase|nr:nucleoside-diphosphate kinase [Verrucomicrobiota bacterium]